MRTRQIIIDTVGQLDAVVYRVILENCRSSRFLPAEFLRKFLDVWGDIGLHCWNRPRSSLPSIAPF